MFWSVHALDNKKGYIDMIVFNERTGEFEEVTSSYSNRKPYIQRNASVAYKVKSIIVDKLGVEPYEVNDYSSWSDLGADSLDAVELIMEFEKEFSMTIPDEVAEHIRTVGNYSAIALHLNPRLKYTAKRPIKRQNKVSIFLAYVRYFLYLYTYERASYGHIKSTARHDSRDKVDA